jgi:hypothetical protein
MFHRYAQKKRFQLYIRLFQGGHVDHRQHLVCDPKAGCDSAFDVTHERREKQHPLAFGKREQLVEFSTHGLDQEDRAGWRRVALQQIRHRKTLDFKFMPANLADFLERRHELLGAVTVVLVNQVDRQALRVVVRQPLVGGDDRGQDANADFGPAIDSSSASRVFAAVFSTRIYLAVRSWLIGNLRP